MIKEIELNDGNQSVTSLLSLYLNFRYSNFLLPIPNQIRYQPVPIQSSWSCDSSDSGFCLRIYLSSSTERCTFLINFSYEIPFSAFSHSSLFSDIFLASFLLFWSIDLIHMTEQTKEKVNRAADYALHHSPSDFLSYSCFILILDMIFLIYCNFSSDIGSE